MRHSDASDGVATLREMAEATRKRGYAYFGVTDHSKSAHYAGGAVGHRNQRAAPRHQTS